MKRIVFIINLLFAAIIVVAQVPAGFSYQAVVRNSSGEIITNQNVKFQFTILRDSESGTPVYQETHSVPTNSFGLANLKVGMGTKVSGTFDPAAWGNNKHYLKVELDPDNGTNFSLLGTSQLLAVPYAFHAATAENLTGAITETDPLFTGWDKSYLDLIDTPDIKDTIITYINGSETKLSGGTNITISGNGTLSNPYLINHTESSLKHYPGEIHSGGIVFYVYDNGLHGLIASLEDLSDGIIWGNMATDILDAESAYDGAANTAAIVGQVGAASSYAAGLCKAYTGGNQTDWYLPSSWELNLLYNAAFLISFKLENDSEASTQGLNFVMPFYWSSTECLLWSNAWLIDISKGQLINDLKSNISNVRGYSQVLIAIKFTSIWTYLSAEN